MTPQPSATPSFEEYLDLLAYSLATDARTQQVTWILGDVGMGTPQETPFGYLSPRNDKVRWITARGGTGGLSGGVAGVDDWDMVVPITVAFEPHTYLDPVPAAPPAGSPVNPSVLGGQPPFLEQPGYRTSIEIVNAVAAVLRSNITVYGEIATSTLVESTYVLQSINGKLYRAARLTVAAQQRRRRGT